MDTRLLDMPGTRENARYKPAMPIQRLQILHHARLALQKLHEEQSPKTTQKGLKKAQKTDFESNRSPWLKPYEAKVPIYPTAYSTIDKDYPMTPYSERYDFYRK